MRPVAVADAVGGAAGGVVVQSPPPTTQNIPAGQVLLNQPATPPNFPAVPIGNDQATDMNPMNLQQLFPCNNPVNPHMRSIDARMATYEVGWNNDRVRATPRQLAESGMYYLG